MQHSSRLALYEHLHTQYLAMLTAAENNEWESLVGLEREAAETCRLLRETSESQLDDQSTQAEDLIREILALDGEIRTHVQPFLDSTRKLLSGVVRDNNVRKAYGTFGP